MSDKGSAIFLVGSIAGVVIGLGRGIPYLGGCLDCLGAIVAGGAAVWYYTQDRPAGVGGGTGASLGAGTAAVAALVNGVVGAIFTMIGQRPSWEETTKQALQRMRTAGWSEQQLEAVRQLLESMWFPVAVTGCALVIYVLLGALGGAIGTALFRNDELPEAPPESADGAPQDGGASSGGVESNRDGSV